MLFGLSKALRSLTMSRVTSALDQIHRAERQRLDAGGAATATSAKSEPAAVQDFVLPKDH